MLDLLLIILAIPALVLLYFQWKIMRKQERFLKTESKSLEKLRKKNKRFVDSGLFGLPLKSSYLQTSASESRLPEHRKKILSGYLRKTRKDSEIPTE